MKILKINKKEIYLEENNFELFKFSYEDKEEIVIEVYKLFSNLENIGEIRLDFFEELPEDDFFNIVEIIKSRGGKVLNKKEFKLKLKIINLLILLIFGFEMFLFLFVRIKNITLLEKKETLKLELQLKEEELDLKNNEYLNMNAHLLVDNFKFEKKLVSKDLNKLFKCLNDNIYLKKVEIDEKIIKVLGLSKTLDEISSFEKNLIIEVDCKVMYDFIKLEGGEYLFLMELKINS